MGKPYDHVELRDSERTLIHLFDFYDHIEASGFRELFTPSPSAFTSYFKAENATTRQEKLRAIRLAKEQKTRHLIYAKQKFGRLPWKMIKKNWTMCGWTRLLVAYLRTPQTNAQASAEFREKPIGADARKGGPGPV